MDLPELRTWIAKFLNTHDLAVASAICKSWHSSFIPPLYRKLRWNGRSKFPKADALLKYGSNVREFYITRNTPRVDLSALTYLQILHLRIMITDRKPWAHLTRLFQQNRNLVEVSINSISGPTMLFPTETFRSMMTILSLRTLALGHLKLDSESTELFFDTCRQLQELSLYSTNLFLSNSSNRLEKFPSMKSLSLDSVSNLTPAHQLEIIKRCPQIKTLCWGYIPVGLVSELCQVLAQDCPLLEKLALKWDLSDEDCSSIIDSSVRLTDIAMSSSNFGPKALNSCSRYFSTLTCLNVSGCFNFTSPMAQHVMTSCHHLRKFNANILDAQDILGIVEETQGYEEEESESSQTPITTMTALQPRQKDWICLDLRSLSLFITGFEGKPRDWQRRVLDQIAKLVKLEQIDVGTFHFNFDLSDGLNLRLEAGLDISESLVNIKDFAFNGLSPEMEEEEVRWMIRAWPKLKSIGGTLNPQEGRRKELEKLLRIGVGRANIS